MNGYKKIFKSRKLRLKILRLLSFVPDAPMLKLQYRIKTGRRLELKNPVRLSEKLQWYKLYYRDPLMITCADKYDVRGYVEKKGLESILTKCYGVFDTAEELDLDALPESFVLKDTLGGGGNSVIICDGRQSPDREKLLETVTSWVSSGTGIRDGGREWPYYSGKKHRIIAEEYIPAGSSNGLVDYKFYCFGGKCEMVYVIYDRKLGESVKIGIYDRSLKKLPVYRKDEEHMEGEFDFPDNMDEMIRIAEKLSEDFPFVRVDLYNENRKIIFGELTFFPASGYIKYEPDSFDAEIGKKFVLPEKKKL